MGWIQAVAGIPAAKAQYLDSIREREAAEDEAVRNERQAAVLRGASHREASREREIGAHQKSRGLAIAAASGAGVQNPSILNAMAEIEAEAEYRAQSRLYTGEDEARGFEQAAATARLTRKRTGYAGKVKALTAIGTAIGKLWNNRAPPQTQNAGNGAGWDTASQPAGWDEVG